VKGFIVSNLLLITDVARLRKIFGRLTEDRNIRLRVVNNLEKGGEELAIEKPDVVFVQTHLSGLSADILIMHLKKQLGRKRSRFVLLASPSQTSNTILKPYQGWLDTSADDSHLLSELQQLLITLLTKPKKIVETVAAEPVSPPDFQPLQMGTTGFTPLPVAAPLTEEVPLQQTAPALQLPAVTPVAAPADEPSLEEQGITYAPRQRLKIYSEFNSSFDNAVSGTAEPETLEQATPSPVHDWGAEDIDIADTKPARSKRGTFLLWLAPVIVAVVVITYLQQQKPVAKAPDIKVQLDAKVKPDVKAKPDTAKLVQPAVVKPVPVAQAPHANVTPEPAKAPVVARPVITATPHNQERVNDKAVLTSIAENRGAKSPVPVAASGTRPSGLPDFIPRYGYDKNYSATNPGWERYKGQVTEFKVLREDKKIKAIQVIDRGGNGVPESFMKAVLRQVSKKPVINVELSEKKDDYEVQRGRIADNIKVVYYRDGNGGKLRAFVLTWQ
jgi:hypothetical protein